MRQYVKSKISFAFELRRGNRSRVLGKSEFKSPVQQHTLNVTRLAQQGVGTVIYDKKKKKQLTDFQNYTSKLHLFLKKKYVELLKIFVYFNRLLLK